MAAEIEKLSQRRDELKARLQAILRDLEKGLEKDAEEQAIQLENMEVLQEIACVSEEELREIDLKLSGLRAAD